MAHISQEHTFRAIGRFRSVGSLLEGELCLFAIADIHHSANASNRLSRGKIANHFPLSAQPAQFSRFQANPLFNFKPF